jgi:hypothetical protein
VDLRSRLGRIWIGAPTYTFHVMSSLRAIWKKSGRSVASRHQATCNRSFLVIGASHSRAIKINRLNDSPFFSPLEAGCRFEMRGPEAHETIAISKSCLPRTTALGAHRFADLSIEATPPLSGT